MIDKCFHLEIVNIAHFLIQVIINRVKGFLL